MDIISRISRWWLDINLKTRLITFTILIVSLTMSALTFWSLIIIQEDSIISDSRFCKDLGILLASNLLDFVELNNQKELASFLEKIYLSTSSISYIIVFHSDGTLFFSLPVYTDSIQNFLQLHRNLFQLETQDLLFGVPLIKVNNIFNYSITDVIIPLNKNGKNFGSLELGINSSVSFSSNAKLIMHISIAIFVSTWLMFSIGAAFNFLTIVEPINKLFIGITNIASGNFKHKIVVPFKGELADLISVFNEMAERLESYENKNVDELILEKMKLETIVSTIADGVILIDKDLRFLFINQIAVKAFHWSSIDIIGKSLCDYFPVHVNEALLPILNNLVQSSYLYQQDYRTQEICINFDYSSKKIFRFLLTAVVDYNHVLSSVTIVVHDISQENELKEAKHQFMANVSHELRTPLCNIGSFLETLLDYNNTLSNQQKIKFLHIANRETKRLSTLVNDILDLSQLESDYIYTMSSINLLDVIHDIVQSHHIIAHYNNISLIIEFDRSVKYIYANESSLSQVFANLITNAIKFTSINGQIILRVYKVNKVNCQLNAQDLDQHNSNISKIVRVEIIDEGIGVEEVYQRQIFDRFVRIENDIHSLEGTGLGLSIVNNILVKHNTKIFLHSEPSVGTSLWFDLLSAD